MVNISVQFYSYYKELTGCAGTRETLPDGSTLEDLWRSLATKFSRLQPLRRSTLMAVGVEYQPAEYALRDGDEVSFFPPVQGG